MILVLLGVVVAAGLAIWFITPTWQCPVCHSYKIAEWNVDGQDWLECQNEGCRHAWKAM